jgi:uncharacterized SAM-binding protein YcdF (DUF218 family)
VGRRRFTGFRIFLVCAALAAILFFTRVYWLPAIAAPLVHDEGPGHADMIVVLGGDATGRRIMRAVDLIRQGYAPVALVSGTDGYYGGYESDLEIAYALKQGARPEWFIPFHCAVQSTKAEAQATVPELRRRGVKSILLVTSDYHTGRAGRVFRKAAQGAGISVRTTAAPDRFFRTSSWWRNREAEKIVLLEWCKTIASAFGV